MGIQIALRHRTRYKYDKPIRLGPHVVRLRPAPHCRTPILSYGFAISPANHLIHWQQDPHSNHLARVVFTDLTDELVVDVDLVAELSARNVFDFLLEPEVEDWPFDYPQELARDVEPYRVVEPAGRLFQTFLDGIPKERRGTVGFLVDLNRRVRDDVSYVVRLTPGIQACEQTLQNQRGSCRDSAWLLVQLLRHLGFAARFVSGYLIQLVSDESPNNGSGAAMTDSAEFHAWAEAFLPGAGWIGLDATSGMLAGEGHIPLACAPDPTNAAAITGSVESADAILTYQMSVRRLNERPSFSKPIKDADWTRVELVAHQVDADLDTQDVRLTMGGEPTFVGKEEPDKPEWNIEAMGPLKRKAALTLIRRLRNQLANGGLLHFGQGKWYPGETLPRWALSCYWRVDGIPIWENIDLVAQESDNHAFANADAFEFILALTRRLQVSSSNVLAAYEDSVYHLLKERSRPVKLDLAERKLTATLEHEELASVLERGLVEPAGYLLPLRRRQNKGRLYWSSQLWFPAPERFLLLEGNSPLGYRLSLDVLPWVAPDDIEYEFDDTPFADREKLPSFPVHNLALFETDHPDDPLPADPKTEDSSKLMQRPALCVQTREGRLHVFVPFTPKLPDYLDLIAAIEDTSAYLNKPVWLEGYPPPSDPRLRSFSLTPDPGVLEVNLPPASSWAELQRINNTVFEEAREVGLTAEKFLPDGRHMSTGGGNHIVIGGLTTSDSPLLRRPDLLRSMLAFWQNHPALSYLFSGRFIGPTSQHPRVDEARMDALYELEIAFAHLPCGECPSALMDRAFRNLLVDITGNTHRAEFCMDKLYPPEGTGLRLGLLELRAFEMAPHVRMVLVQLLLVRALVAMFWKQPYEGKLIRWGTGLHDRFLLPQYVKQDFDEVLTALQRFGYAFDPAWYEPHFEFRFPKIGSITVGGLQLELRQALEPWHVLGEDASSGATVRSVDSSLERVQVKVSGFTPDSRYVVACNGRRLPLQPLGQSGEAVAGVRYRAWQPPVSLHPTIPIHTPLVFDIVDLWNQHSIGGCSYHVLNPAGRPYASRPINAAEAESRRVERFQNFGHTPGPMTAPEEEPNPSFPVTLDLRWPSRGQEDRLNAPLTS